MDRGGIICAVLSPHAPIIVPEIGEDSLARVKSTSDALRRLSAMIVELDPDSVVVVSPHGPVLRSSVTLVGSPSLEGNFREFGVNGRVLRYRNDLRLLSRIVAEAEVRHVPVYAADLTETGTLRFPTTLHYSILVPLYYLEEAGYQGPLVAGAVGPLGPRKLYSFGQVVQAASRELGLRVVYVASGDLSHRLTDRAPAGYDPMGRVFDRTLVEALGRFDREAVLNLDPTLVERAGECGLGPIYTLLGALDGLEVEAEIFSYEGPFGVGYCVARFVPRETKPGAGEPGPAGEESAGAGNPPRSPSHPLVRLARRSLEAYVREGRWLTPPADGPGLDRKAGAFVSLKRHGRLRGCIGTIRPAAPTLAEEIIRNAVQAATADPRFLPVQEAELETLEYSVDVLDEPEPVAGPEELDPRTYGVIVTKGQRTGLLLPDLEGVDTVEQQIEIARRKAGIGPDETGVKLFRFRVTRYY